MIYGPNVTVNCDVPLCMEAVEVTLKNPSLWIIEVEEAMKEAGWSDERDGHFCERHQKARAA